MKSFLHIILALLLKFVMFLCSKEMYFPGYYKSQFFFFFCCRTGFFKQRATCLRWDYSVASVRCVLSVISSAHSDHSEPRPFILVSVFVYLAAPAYFLSNDTPQWGGSCAVFPINTPAYFRAAVLQSEAALFAPPSVSCTRVKAAPPVV